MYQLKSSEFKATSVHDILRLPIFQLEIKSKNHGRIYSDKYVNVQ